MIRCFLEGRPLTLFHLSFLAPEIAGLCRIIAPPLPPMRAAFSTVMNLVLLRLLEFPLDMRCVPGKLARAGVLCLRRPPGIISESSP